MVGKWLRMQRVLALGDANSALISTVCLSRQDRRLKEQAINGVAKVQAKRLKERKKQARSEDSELIK